MPATFTTTLPDAQQPTLGNGVEDEISVDNPDVINYGAYRIQVRETGQSTWDASAIGFAEETLTADGDLSGTETAILTGREDGEEYEVRARTETEHATGAWTSTSTIVTKFPGATGLAVSNVGETDADLTWTDNSDNEDGFKIWRREEKTNKRDTGWTAWEVVADLAPNTTTYTATDLHDNWNYEWYVEAYTEHTSADSSAVAATTDLTITPGWFLELRKDGDKVAVQNEHIVDVSIQPEASGVGRWTVKLPDSPYASTWKRARAFLRYDGTLLMRGTFTETRSQESTAEITLRGKDIIEQLKRGGSAVTYSNIRADEALRDYLSTHTNFVYTVHTPSSQTIERNKVVQDADTATELTDLFTPAATDPVEATNGRLGLLQTCWTTDGLDDSRNSGATSVSGSEYTGGDALRLTSTGNWVEYDFTPQYDIPASAVGAQVRLGTSDPPETTITLNGETVASIGSTTSGTGPIGWFDMVDGLFGSGYAGGDLQAGTTYTLRVEVTSAGSSETLLIDHVAPHDTRYTYTFDNSVDANGALSGPELRPDAVTLETIVHDDTYNVAHADLVAALDDVSGNQKLQVSNDQGSTWLPSDGSEEATESISVDFSTVGTDILARVTLSRYGTQSSTPTQGIKGQSIDTWTLDIDTNSIRVIDSQDLAGNHFSNIDQLCEIAGTIFVPVYKEGQLELEVFEPGQVTKTVPWEDHEVLDHEFVDTTEGYANQVTVYGAVDPSTSTRYQATASSQTEIDRIGETVPDVVFDPSLQSDAAVENKAAAEVARRIANDTVTGWLEIVPKYIQPGYAYQVPQFDDKIVMLQSAQLQLHSEGMRLDFEQRADLAQVLNTVSIQIGRTQAAIE